MAFFTARMSARFLRSAVSGSRSIFTPSRPSQTVLSITKTQCSTIHRGLTRSLWHLSRGSGKSTQDKTPHGLGPCSCCGIHSQGDTELTRFLAEEIKLEQQNHRQPSLIDGFSVHTDEANVTLSKEMNNEKIVVKFNVNHSVADASMEMEGDDDSQLVSAPTFTVELTKGSGKILSFSCGFLPAPENPAEQGDKFEILEMTTHSGEWREATYTVSGDILDGNLYDLLMNLLEERGVDNKFAGSLQEWCTDYEHECYINLLNDLEKFAKSD